MNESSEEDEDSSDEDFSDEEHERTTKIEDLSFNKIKEDHQIYGSKEEVASNEGKPR